MSYCCCTPQIHCRYCQKAAKPFKDVKPFFKLSIKAMHVATEALAGAECDQQQSNEQVEPVAWIEHHKGGDNLNWEEVNHPYAKATPLYTHPPVPTAQPKEEIPKAVLLAISNAGLTLVKTHNGYKLEMFAGIKAQSAQPKEPEQRSVSEHLEPVAFPDAPQTIYLQVGDECPEDAKWKELVDVCWCDEQVFDNDIVYVRADTTPPQPQNEVLGNISRKPWVSLSDEDIKDAIKEAPKVKTGYAGWVGEQRLLWGRAIEAKLKEKNTK